MYLEEVEAKLRQEEVVVTTDHRRKELEKLILEIGVINAKKHFFVASRSPTKQPYPYAYAPPGHHLGHQLRWCHIRITMYSSTVFASSCHLWKVLDAFLFAHDGNARSRELAGRKEFIIWPTDEQRVAMSRRYSTKFVHRRSVFINALQILRSVWNPKCSMCYTRKDYNTYEVGELKGFHSVNVGAIADLDLEFIWLNVAFPGKMHDSSVFHSDSLYKELQCGRKRGVLLCDSVVDELAADRDDIVYERGADCKDADSHRVFVRGPSTPSTLELDWSLKVQPQKLEQRLAPEMKR
ncbi:unnamed protein product [Heligmosomoides polygyrus]|uniref:DDE Tnp4 domain-containing protein n=1 Tax=Heligmosomoides polygyrus TaxID=6339 RepID=A0A3P8BU84_HELPZ|nr:unnamed protein product [Heligmosomoides polygyrus]